MSEPNNERQHMIDHTLEFKSDVATGPMRSCARIVESFIYCDTYKRHGLASGIV